MTLALAVGISLPTVNSGLRIDFETTSGLAVSSTTVEELLLTAFVTIHLNTWPLTKNRKSYYIVYE